ncbi:MAG: MgtE protein [Desulfobulbaceae bacterium]|nr:MgtE protein [Desulfobulbaceae bacterium]HIJ90411.1 MgtE protein [Deltaproteobacteria bacterium]
MKMRKRRSVIQILIVLLTLAVTIPAFTEEKSPVRLTSQEISVSAALKEREEALAAREKALAAKEKELAALNKEVDEKFTQLNALQEELKGQLGRAGKGKDQQFKNLIKVYSAMSPSKVAPLLDKMEDVEAVEILRAMKTEAVAKIIPKLSQDKAVRVSRLLGLP